MLCPAATDHADEVAVKQANFPGDLPLMRWARYRQTGSKAVPVGTLCWYCNATRRRWLPRRDLTTAMLLQELKSDQQAWERFKEMRDRIVAREAFG